MLVFRPLPEAERTPERTHFYSHIECDVCEVQAPSSTESAPHGGLIGLGWFIDGGLHRCPLHYHEEVPARGPQYRDE